MLGLLLQNFTSFPELGQQKALDQLENMAAGLDLEGEGEQTFTDLLQLLKSHVKHQPQLHGAQSWQHASLFNQQVSDNLDKLDTLLSPELQHSMQQMLRQTVGATAMRVSDDATLDALGKALTNDDHPSVFASEEEIQQHYDQSTASPELTGFTVDPAAYNALQSFMQQLPFQPQGGTLSLDNILANISLPNGQSLTAPGALQQLADQWQQGMQPPLTLRLANGSQQSIQQFTDLPALAQAAIRDGLQSQNVAIPTSLHTPTASSVSAELLQQAGNGISPQAMQARYALWQASGGESLRSFQQYMTASIMLDASQVSGNKQYVSPSADALTRMTGNSSQQVSFLPTSATNLADATTQSAINNSTAPQNPALSFAGTQQALTFRPYGVPAGTAFNSEALANQPLSLDSDESGLWSTLAQPNNNAQPENRIPAQLTRPQTQTYPTPSEQLAVRFQGIGQLDQPDSISIQLEPAELGRVEVRMDISRDQGTQILITAEKSETLDLLQRDARELARALQQAGIKAESNEMQFNLRDDGQAGQQQSQQDDQPKQDGMMTAQETDSPQELRPIHSVSGSDGYTRMVASDGLDIQV